LKKDFNNIFSLFFIFLLVVSTVNAFEIFQESSSSPLCPRDTGLFVDVIKNSGVSSEDYNINLRGSASGWATTVPKSFVLAPGDSKKVYTYVTPSQNANSGSYILEEVISSSSGTKIAAHTIIVKDCFRVGLTAPFAGQESCPDDNPKYEFTLVNNGEFRETFTLSVEGQLKDAVTLSDKIIILDKGDSKKIIAFLKAPAKDAEYGFTVIAVGSSGSTRNSIPFLLKVNPCYDFKFAVLGDTSHSICERSYVVVPLRLENKGTTINAYKINLDGPVWARVERNEFTLLAGESKNFNLVFAPAFGVEGKFNAKLDVVPDRGYSKFSTIFDVAVRKCHGVGVDILDNKGQACQGVSSEFKSLIKNSGEVRKSYALSLDAPAWTSIKEGIITLESKDVKTFDIKALPTSDVKPGVYDVKLDVKSTDDSGIAASDSIKVEVVAVDDCYKPKLRPLYDNVVVYHDSSVALPVNIENAGVRKATYNLFLSGSSSVFSRLNPDEISVEPGKTETAYLYIAPKTNVKLGKYDARIRLSLKNGPALDSKDIEIEITDVRSRATKINLGTSGEDVNASSFSVQESGSFFSGLRNWLGRDQVEEPAKEVADTGAERFVNQYRYHILGAIILLVLVILFFSFGMHSRVVEFFEEEVEDSKPVNKRKQVRKNKVKTRKKIIANEQQAEQEEIKEKVNEQ